MFEKQIGWFGRQCLLRCDGNCGKAWGVNNRPRESFDPDEPDDYAFLADHEVGAAPDDPGTYEGGHCKPAQPVTDASQLNKWCSRECERSAIDDVGEPVELPDLSRRLYNMPWKRKVD